MKTATKRSAIYLDPELHKALRIKSVETEHSIAEPVNDTVRYSLAEDSIDLSAFEKRKNELLVSFESVSKNLKKDGKI